MNPEIIGVFIPIVAIVFGIGIGALSIWSEHKRKSQLLEQLHKERLIALEKGIEPPDIAPGLVGFLNNKPTLTPKYLWPRAMRNGLWLLFGGVVLYMAINQSGGHQGATFALIPAVIGVANLIYAAVVRHQERNDPPPGNGR
jgi:hypothetical protein